MTERTISKTKISQTIDLQEEFGVDFTGKKALKEKIGQLLIDKMLERTAKGVGLNGKALKRPYSKSYKSSGNYEKYGKTGTVNMELKGNMLEDTDVRNITANTLDIAITNSTEKKKAFNHITGDTLPRRDFFGVTKKEIKSVKADIAGELKEAKKESKASLSDAALALSALQGNKGQTALAALVDSLVETPFES